MIITLYQEQLEDFNISKPKILCLGFKEKSIGRYIKVFDSIEDFYSLITLLALENTSSRKTSV